MYLNTIDTSDLITLPLHRQSEYMYTMLLVSFPSFDYIIRNIGIKPGGGAGIYQRSDIPTLYMCDC